MNWTDKLLEYNDKELKKDECERLNFKYELHMSRYILQLLGSNIIFKINKGDLQIMKDKKEISVNEFIYWWQITRYEEISSEQKKIKDKIRDINNKLVKISKLYPISGDMDDEETKKKKTKKREELDQKRNKLIEFMKKDEINIKKKITLLNNFKMLCITIPSIHELLGNIKLYVEFAK
jgi:hypothetical protein